MERLLYKGKKRMKKFMKLREKYDLKGHRQIESSINQVYLYNSQGTNVFKGAYAPLFIYSQYTIMFLPKNEKFSEALRQSGLKKNSIKLGMVFDSREQLEAELKILYKIGMATYKGKYLGTTDVATGWKLLIVVYDLNYLEK